MKKWSAAAFLTAISAFSLMFVSGAFADGSETLGPPSVPITGGATGVVVSGLGTEALPNLPGAFSVNVPSGATVKQVLLYWEGHWTDHGPYALHTPQVDGDNSITINGNPVVGTKIGGSTPFFGQDGGAVHGTENFVTYRSDITSMGLVGAGANVLTVNNMLFESNFPFDFPFNYGNDGVGVVVTYNDGTSSVVNGLRDGSDLAFKTFAPPLNTTVPQTFTFASQAADRAATLSTLAASVRGQDNLRHRGNILHITFDVGAPVDIVDPWQSTDGFEFDAINTPVTIPAGATSMTVQALSEGANDALNEPASFDWISAGLTIPVAPPPPSCPGALCALYGKPQLMVMNYRGDLDNNNTQASGKTVLLAGGDPAGATNVRVVVTDSATAGAGHVFADVSGLNPGDNFVIDATMGGQTKLGTQTYIYLFSSGGTLLEKLTVHTSCSQPLNLGDTFLGFGLVGYKGDSGFGTGTPPPGGTFQPTGCPLCQTIGKPKKMVLTYLGNLDNSNTQAAGKTVVLAGGNPNGATNVHIVVSDSSTAGSGHIFFDGTGLNPGDNFTADATLGGATKFSAQTYIYVYSSGGSLLEKMTLHTSCSQPLALNDTFEGFKLVGYVGETGLASGVQAAPGPTGVAIIGSSLVNKNLTLSVRNYDSTSVQISQVNVNWPAANGKLMNVKLGGKTLFDTQTAAGPLTFTSFKGTTNDRTLNGSTSKDLVFAFEKNISTIPGDYSITVTFSNSSFLTFP